jgi:hypothetical protein
VVRFAPPASGEYDASLNITNNDSDENPYRIVLRARGVAYPEMLVTHNFVDSAGEVHFLDVPYETEFSYEDTRLGETSDLIFGIRNLGEGDLVLVGNPPVNLGGDVDDFAVTLQPFDKTQPPGGQGAYRIAFTPTQTGLRSATVSIPNNDPRQPSYTYRIFGYGINLNPQVVDCNGNGLDDAVDLNSGASADCNANTVPDECESDSDGDGVIDDCDSAADCGDNCPGTSNPDQADLDIDGAGDAGEEFDVDDSHDAGLCGVGTPGVFMLMALSLLGTRCRRRSALSKP